MSNDLSRPVRPPTRRVKGTRVHKTRTVIAGAAVGVASLLTAGISAAPAMAGGLSCAGPSSSSGNDGVAGPVYANVPAGYAGVQTDQGYAEVNSDGAYPLTPVAEASVPGASTSARVAADGSGACVDAGGQTVTG